MIEPNEYGYERVRDGYSPERSMKIAGIAGLGSMLALAGLFMSGKSSAAPSAVPVPTVGASTPIDTAASPSTVGRTQPQGTVPVVPTTAVACGASYVVQPGDFWLRVAHKASVSVDQLMAVNNATSSTPLYAGQTICLPAGAALTTTPPTSATTVATAPATVKVTTPVTVKVTPTTAKPAPVTTQPKSHSGGSRA
jgi:LysM repeat protein